MQVILTESIDKLGNQGEMINVANGYARNFLLPRGLAMVANPKNVHRLEHQKRLIDDKRKREMVEIDDMIDRLEELKCEISVRVGEEDKIFGSVTSRDIAEGFAALGVEIDRRKIHIEDPIKALGMYTVVAKLAPEKTANLKVWVVKKID